MPGERSGVCQCLAWSTRGTSGQLERRPRRPCWTRPAVRRNGCLPCLPCLPPSLSWWLGANAGCRPREAPSSSRARRRQGSERTREQESKGAGRAARQSCPELSRAAPSCLSAIAGPDRVWPSAVALRRAGWAGQAGIRISGSSQSWNPAIRASVLLRVLRVLQCCNAASAASECCCSGGRALLPLLSGPLSPLPMTASCSLDPRAADNILFTAHPSPRLLPLLPPALSTAPATLSRRERRRQLFGLCWKSQPPQAPPPSIALELCFGPARPHCTTSSSGLCCSWPSSTHRCPTLDSLSEHGD